MSLALIERPKMGRPKRSVGTTSIKIEDDAYDLVRKAALFSDESVVAYASRILRERALSDLERGAEAFLKDSKARKSRGDK